MFYTTVAGWLLLYFVKMAKGDFAGLDSVGVANEYASLMQEPGLMTVFMVIVVLLCMLVCSRGLQNGVEKVNKAMMLCLLMVMVVLVVFWMSWITFPPGPITGPIISCGMTICTMRGTQGL